MQHVDDRAAAGASTLLTSTYQRGGASFVANRGGARNLDIHRREWNQEAGDADRGSKRRGESTSMRPRIHTSKFRIGNREETRVNGPGLDAVNGRGGRIELGDR